jgi:hypothetical protein
MESSYFTPSELRSASFRAWVAELYQRTPKFRHHGRPSKSRYVPASANAIVLVRRGDSDYVRQFTVIAAQIRPTGRSLAAGIRARMDDRELKAKVIVVWHRRASRRQR